MDLKRVGIFSNPKKDINFDGAKHVANCLRSQGAQVFFDASGMPDGETDMIDYAAIDCLIVLGGDGTILRAAAFASAYCVPMLGINLGRMGFMAEVELCNIEKAIQTILDDDYYIEKRIMLYCRVVNGNKIVFQADVLNDAAVIKRYMARLINVELVINGAIADKVPCDGMLISTPTGSTGYSLSAGGPIISPQVECILATPICPHALHSRAIIASAEDELTLRPTSPDGMVLTTDGVLQRDIEDGEVVKIRRSEHYARFIRFHENYFYPLLRTKFINWDR